MTVETQVAKVEANGNDSATVFSFSPIVIFEESDLVVIHVDSEGTEDILTEGVGASNYSVSVSDFPGTGSITYPADEVTPLPTGESLIIKRVLPLEQTTDLENQGGYFPDVQETQFDKLLMIDIQQQEEIDRSVKLLISSDADPEVIAANLEASLGNVEIPTAGIADDAVTNAKLSNMAQATIKGRASGAGTGDPVDLTASQVRTIINVENGATADQTAGEIKTLYESNANTNAFTDADEAKLDGIEAGADVTDTANVMASIDILGLTSLGNPQAGDLVLGHGIASGQLRKFDVSNLPYPVDSVNSQTGSVVLDADDISDSATTNKFTTAGDISKLAGIEAGADVTDTANVMPAIDIGAQTEELTPATGDWVLGELATGELRKFDVGNLPGGGGGGGLDNVVEDTTPQLGGNLDVNGNAIVSVSAGNIAITPDTTGSIVLDGLSWPQADGSADQVLVTDGAGQLSWTSNAGSGIAAVVDDTSPQLGGDLDANGFDINLQGGTEAAPSLAFGVDPDTGIYRFATNALGFTTGGARRAHIGSTGLQSLVPFRGENGSATAPAFTFSGDPNTGLYSVGADQLGVTVGGTLRVTFNTANLTSTVPFLAPAGSSTAPAYSFSGDADSGMYSLSGDVLGFTVGGVQAVTLTEAASVVIMKLQNGPVQGLDGTAAAPTYSFSDDDNTGLYSVGGDQLGVAVGGTLRVTFNTTGVDFNDLTITQAVIGDYAIQNASPASSSGTLTLDYTTGPDFDLELAENVTTISVTNPSASGNLAKVTLQLRQPTSGTHTVNFDGFDFGDAGAPTMPTGTGAILEVALWTRDGGSTWYGSAYFEKAGA